MYVDTLQIRYSEALIFRVWQGLRRTPDKNQIQSLLNAPKYTGVVTDAAAKRMRKAISLLIQKSPKQKIWNSVINKFHDFKLGFVTLTIADQGRDTAEEVYIKCLSPFLRWLRYRNVKDYIWKAELQKRGEMHYHIAINQFIHYQLIQDKWNNLQRKAGYLYKYAKKYKHFRPNSVDIHSVQNVENVEAYLSKYLTKNSAANINGKVWDCSQNLKSAKYFSAELTWRNLDGLRQESVRERQGEHCTFFKMKPGKTHLILDQYQLNCYYKHLSSI